MTPPRSAATAGSTREKYVRATSADFSAWECSADGTDPYVTMSARHRGGHRRSLRRLSRKGLCLQGLEAGQLVHPLPDGARRSRGRVREPYQPVHLGSFCTFVRSGRRSTLRLPGSGVWPDLDHDSWTIPANMAIALSPDFEYVAVETTGDVYIVAKALLEATAKSPAGSDPNVIAKFPGARVEGAIFRHPFLERDSARVLADYVTLEQGTGAVHTAPGHGQEDFLTGQQYGITTYNPVDAAAVSFTPRALPDVCPKN